MRAPFKPMKNGMNKATFIRKYYGKEFERDFVFLVYEYRGHEYTVYENRANGNEPLSWQHKSEQARIDRLVEDWESKPKKLYRYEDSAQCGIDKFSEFLSTGDDSVFDLSSKEFKERMDKEKKSEKKEMVQVLEQ